MEYLRIKAGIEKAIARNPCDWAAYEDMFALCREYQGENFAVAHDWNHAMRFSIGTALRSVVE